MRPFHYALILVGFFALVGGLYAYNHLQPEAVTAIAVKPTNAVLSVTVTGEVRADTTVNISSPEQALISNIAVDEGQAFRAGQVLVSLTTQDLQGQIAQARGAAEEARAALRVQQQGTRPEDIRRLEAERREAQAEVSRQKALLEADQWAYQDAVQDAQRYRSLRAREYVSQRDLEQVLRQEQQSRRQVDARQAEIRAAQLRVRQAAEELMRAQRGPTQAEIEQARGGYESAIGNLQAAQSRQVYRQLSVPFAGVVVKRLQDTGEAARPGQAILRVVNPATFEVVAYVEESDLSQVRMGTTAYVVLDAKPDLALKGFVTQIGQEVNRENGTVEVTIHFTPEALRGLGGLSLRPGMTADINLMTATVRNRILIPSTAVERTKRGPVVYRFEGNKMVARPVTLRRVSSESYEVLQGLGSGDHIAEIANPTLLEKPRVAPLIRKPKTES